jgi:hypothetical protein
VVISADLIAAGLQSGWAPFSNAATPLIWGHDIDVPAVIQKFYWFNFISSCYQVNEV